MGDPPPLVNADNVAGTTTARVYLSVIPHIASEVPRAYARELHVSVEDPLSTDQRRNARDHER